MKGRVGLATMCAWLALTASASATPTWLPPEDIAGPTESITFPEIAVNARGDALAIWPRDIGSATVVETLERPAGGEWSAPQAISEPGEVLWPLQTPVDIGLDDAGNAVAIWAATEQDLRTASRPAGGEWSDPEDLFTNGARGPQLAMNAAGDAVAVWNGFNGDKFVTWAAVRPAGGEWSNPEDLSVAGELDSFDPQVAIDAAGTAIVVWERLITAGDDVVRASVRTAEGNWSASRDISTASEDVNSPRVAMNAAGEAVAAWAVSDEGDTSLRAATRPFNGDWSGPEEVSDTGAGLALAIDSDGNAFALWPTQPLLGAHVLQIGMRPVGGEWSEPEDLSAVFNRGFQSYDLAVSAASGAIATWTWEREATIPKNGIQAAVRPPGGSWQEPEDISAEGEEAGIPKLGLDADGNAIAVWGRKEASNEYFLEGSGYDFSGPQLNGLQIPAAGAAGHPVNFSVSPFDVFSLGATTWTFGDGSQAASGNAVSHVYGAPGKYSVVVSVADGSGNVSTQTATITVSDVTPPAPPQLLRTDPASPNESGAPRIHGDAEVGSTVRLYAGPTCTGQPVATVSAGALVSPGIAVVVAESVTATFSATATDASANTSACSAPISYTRLEPPLNCTVPEVVGKKLRTAKRKIRAAGCAVGQVSRPRAKKGKKRGPLVVRSSKPRAGRTLPAGGEVDLVLRRQPKKARR